MGRDRRFDIRRLLAVLALAPVAGGCAYAAGGALAFVGGGGGGGGGGSNQDPSAQLVAIPRGDETEQTIRLRLTDREGDLTSLKLRFRSGGGAALPVVAGPAVDGEPGVGDGGDGASDGFTDATILRVLDANGTPVFEGPAGETSQLETSSQGSELDVIWGWSEDVGPEALQDVDLEVQLFDSKGKPIEPPLAFTAPKVGNNAPGIVGDIELDGAGRRIVVRWRMNDSTGDVCKVVATFSVAGGVTDEPVDEIVGGRVAGLLTRSREEILADNGDEGDPFDITWDTINQDGIGPVDVTVRVTLAPMDETGAMGVAVTSDAHQVDNNDPPEVLLVTPRGRFHTGVAAIPFEVRDAEANGTSLRFAFEEPGAGGPFPADGTIENDLGEVAAVDDGLGDAAVPPGQYLFIWPYAAGQQLGSNAPRRVTIAIEPRNGSPSGELGDEETTGLFFIGNGPPIVEIDESSLPLVPTGNIPVTFRITDASRDPADIAEEVGGLLVATVEWEFTNETNQVVTGTATPAGGTELLFLETGTGAPDDPPPPHTFIWDSANPNDLPAIDGVDVKLRIKSNDNRTGGQGPFDEVLIENVDNLGNRQPVVTIDAPVRTPDSVTDGVQDLVFEIADVDFDPQNPTHDLQDVMVFYQEVDEMGDPLLPMPMGDPGPMATPGPGSPGTQDLEPPDGPFTFRWNYALDLNLSPPHPLKRVKIFIKSFDGSELGTIAETDAFFVGNDTPVIPKPSLAVTGDRGNIVIDFAAADSSSDDCTATLNYSLDQTDFTPIVTKIVGGIDEQTVLQTVPGNGLPYDFTWATAQELCFNNLTGVQVQIVLDDGFAVSEPAIVEIPKLFNDTRPVARILRVGFPGKPLRGRVPVLIEVTDDEAIVDPPCPDQNVGSVIVDIIVAGSNPTPATGILLGQGDVDFAQSLSAVPVGVFGDPVFPDPTVTFLWDTPADVGVTRFGGVDVTVRVTPTTNGQEGLFAESKVQIDNSIRFRQLGTTTSTFSGDAIAPLDFDRDGKRDIVLVTSDASTGQSDSTIMALRGEGDGTLAEFEVTTVGIAIVGDAAVSDLDGDGGPDLAILDADSPPKVGIFIGNTNGAFNAHPLQPSAAAVAGSNGKDLLAADLTADAVPDVAVTAEVGGNGFVHILKNLGDGELVLHLTKATGSTSPNALAAADFTGDGLLDIAVADKANQDVRVLAQGPAGQFTLLAGAVAVGEGPGVLIPLDFDADGDSDLAVLNRESNEVSVLEGNGDGTFVAGATVIVPVGAQDMAACQVTGDGTEDLAVGSSLREVLTIIEGAADGDFETVASIDLASRTNVLAATDLNGDGLSDLVLAPNFPIVDNGIVAALGAGHLDLVASPSLTGVPNGIDAGDFSGDGLADLALSNSADLGAIQALEANGLGGFDLVPAPDVQDLGQTFALAGDFDLDGDADLLAGAPSASAAIEVIESTGGGAFTALPSADPGSVCDPFGPRAPAFAELTGDAFPDLAVSFFGTCFQMVVLEGNGAGGFAQIETLAVALVVFEVAGVDMTEDQVTDLVVTEPGQVNVFRGNGDDTFTKIQNIVGGVVTDLAVADLTDDGIPDVAVIRGGGVSVFWGRGDGTVDPIASVPVLEPRDIALLDATGDGALDVVATTESANVTVVPGGLDGVRAARGEVGGKRGSFRSRGGTAVPAPSGFALTGLEATPDGVPDVALAAVVGLRVLSRSHARGSLPFVGGDPSTVGLDPDEVRVVNAPPLDPTLGELGQVDVLPATSRQVPACRAKTISPDTAVISGGGLVVELQLFAELTADELNGDEGTFRIYRHDRDVQGATGLPYRPPLVGQIVQVASTADASAVIDPDDGIILFTAVGRLGTFQCFREEDESIVPLFRETWDEQTSDELPEGWVSGHTWQVGRPPAPGAPGGPDANPPSGPLTFSPPNVLGTNLRGAKYRGSPTGTPITDSITSPIIVKGGKIDTDPSGGAPGTQKIELTYREWFRLGTGDSTKVEVIPIDGGGLEGAPVAIAAAAHGSGATSASAFQTAGPFNLNSVLAPMVPDDGDVKAFRLRFSITANNDGSEARGLYIEDIDIAIVPGS